VREGKNRANKRGGKEGFPNQKLPATPKFTRVLGKGNWVGPISTPVGGEKKKKKKKKKIVKEEYKGSSKGDCPPGGKTQNVKFGVFQENQEV